MNDKLLKRAAHWIYLRRNIPDWWTHLVLTKYNSDPEQPNISEQDARRVFDVLAEKELLKEDGEIEGIKKYKFNFAKIEEWKEGVTWIQRTFPSGLILFVLAWRKVLVFCGLIIITAFLEDFAVRVGDAIWSRIEWLQPAASQGDQNNGQN